MLRRGGLLGVGVVAVASSTAAFGGATAAAAGQGTAGAIVRIGSLPNLAVGKPQSPNPEVTALLSDPQNHLVFEYTSDACLGSFDEVSLTLVHTGCIEHVSSTLPGGGPIPPVHAIDPVDHVVFFATSGVSDPNPVLGLNHLVAVSETTLAVLFDTRLPLPISVNAYISGLSWYAPRNELLVLSSNAGAIANVATPPPVAVSAYDVPTLLASKTMTSTWQVASVQNCSGTLAASYFMAAAVHATGEDAVYIPCLTARAGTGGEGIQEPSVVKVVLGDRDALGNACGECPTGREVATPAPGYSTDFYFDPGSDRGFMPLNLNGRAALLVYDGHGEAFVGKLDLGTDQFPGLSNIGAIMGLDSATGRMYALDAAGLTTVDGRRSPVAAGTTHAELSAPTVAGSSVVLPGGGSHPFPRLVVPDYQRDGTWKQFAIYADGIAITVDPPAGSVDRGTFAGPIPSGASVSADPHATARGTGFHAIWTSGPAASTSNSNNFSDPLLPVGGPFLRTTSDLLGAAVGEVKLDNGSLQMTASALTDANGKAASGYAQCTDLVTTDQCLNLPREDCFFGFAPQCLVTPTSPLGAPVQSRQTWAFPTVSCAEPGAPGHATVEADGGNVVVPSTAGSSSPAGATPVPDSGSAARAMGDCSGQHAVTSSNGTSLLGAATASSRLGAWAIDPLLSIAASSSNAFAAPPAQDGSAESHVVSSVRGVDVDLGSAGTLSIDDITHVSTARAGGRPGSATTQDKVVVSGVTINGEPVCTSQCDLQAVIDQVNAAFPNVLHVSRPSPDAPFGAQPDGAPAGSPGGYLAAVKSGALQIAADEQYNGMSANEASMVAALRIVVYGVNDGSPNLNRIVLDLAGTEADAEDGLQAGAPFTADGGSLAPQVVDQTAASLLAGVAPFSGASAASPGSNAGSGGGAAVPGGLVGVAVRAFRGLDWLIRSPGRALQMAAFLLLLGLPAIAVRRRWT